MLLAGANWTKAPATLEAAGDQPALAAWPITGATFIRRTTRQSASRRPARRC